jgi:hypothetical protein
MGPGQWDAATPGFLQPNPKLQQPSPDMLPLVMFAAGTRAANDAGSRADSAAILAASQPARDNVRVRSHGVASSASAEARMGLYFKRELQRVVGAGISRLAGGAGASLHHLQALAGLKGRSQKPQGSGFYFTRVSRPRFSVIV